MADGNYVHIRCMVHTLHLVVTAALKECQGVTNVILIARKITGFVHRSNKAVNKLNLISRKSLAFPRTLWCMMCQPGGIPPSTDYHECRDGGRCNVTPSVQCRPLWKYYNHLRRQHTLCVRMWLLCLLLSLVCRLLSWGQHWITDLRSYSDLLVKNDAATASPGSCGNEISHLPPNKCLLWEDL